MKKFEEIADNLQKYLEILLEELNNSGFNDIKSIENINGLYVFYENNIAVYVGRTNRNRMKQRIKEHSAAYSNKNSATFAFKIAKEIKRQPELKDIDAKDPDFLLAKERVSKMQVKHIVVNDPIIQTILEPYLAFKLKTMEKYNDFMTH